MGKSCGNCYRFNDGMYSRVCDECQVSGDAPPSMWKATDSEPDKKLQTGYAIIPMDEYLKMHDEVNTLKKSCDSLVKIAEESAKENEWLAKQIQQLKIELEEQCAKICNGGE